MKLPDSRVFSIHIWHDSQSGKTVTMKLAVSARGDASKLMGSFNAASVVGLERMAGILRHFFFKIDAIAASAASVVAMAGTKVLVSPVSQIMIHNPMTAAFGDTQEMQKAISMLGEIKESITSMPMR